MFENLSIRSKIVAIIAAPVIALLVVSGIGAVQRRQSASNSGSDERLIAVTQADITVASALGVESVVSATPGAGDKLAASRRTTDQAVAKLRARLDDLDSHGDANIQSASESIRRRLDTITTVRRVINGGQSSPDLLTEAFPGAIAEILTLPATLVEKVHSPQVAAQMQSLLALYRYQASVAASNARLAPAVASGGFADTQAAEAFRRSADQEATNQAVFESNALPAARALLRSAQSGKAVDLVDSVHTGASDGTASTIGGGNAVGTWSDAVQQKLQRIGGVGDKLSEQVRADASTSSADATRSANLFILAALLVVAIALGLAWLLARAITRPLRKLTAAARELSTEQLPRLVDGLRNPAAGDVTFLRNSVDALDVKSRDEVGQLAEAFNAVQQVAVDVATEQAELLRKGIGDMFVNLARRNQALLDRQIEFIDELESNEEDADQLEHLFHLDHLATRMRRNAESLLVLAGAEPNRRRGRPVALTDVVRAALGEVEDFARIDLLEVEDVLVTNNAAADVAHLLSELMENATNFSPPDTRVEVVGHSTKSEGYVVSITDTGIGMSPQQMTEANETLANPPLVGLAMSRSLGFIVIGRLAARFGISVRLMPSSGGGVTAVVSMPAVIIHALPSDLPALTQPTVEEEPSIESWTPQVVGSSSELLPPLEFTPFGDDEPPATLEEAVPGGRDFEEGVAGLIEDDAEEIDLDHDDDEDEDGGAASILPALAPSPGTGRRPSAPPSGADQPSRPRLFGPSPEPAVPAGNEAPANGAELPSRGRPVVAEPAPAAMPEPLPVASVSDEEPVSAQGPVFGTRKSRAEGGLFAPPPGIAGEPDGPLGPEDLPSVEPVTAPAVTSRLFGQVGAAPATTVTGGNGTAPDGAPPALPGRTATAAPAGDGLLTRRTPRPAGGGSRPVPGGDGPNRQGVAATKRSPDEVRSLLSNYRSGATKAKSAPANSTDAPNQEGET